MKRATMIWLAVAVCFVLIGGAGFSLAMAALGSDHMKTSTFDISEDFRDISIRSDAENIMFLPSDDGTGKVVCYEAEKEPHSVSVKNGTLSVELTDSRKWYDHIALFSFEAPTITVYLPPKQYASLSIRESTGDITIPRDFLFESVEIDVSTGDVDCNASASGLLRIESDTGDLNLDGLSAGELDLTVSTGKVEVRSVACEGSISVQVSTGKTELTDVTCGSIRSGGNTGDITLKNVIAAETISITRTTGDVRFERCDAGELRIETDTGSVTGSLLSDKVFLTQTDTGKASVPKTVTGGRCEITTDTGDIRIEVIK